MQIRLWHARCRLSPGMGDPIRPSTNPFTPQSFPRLTRYKVLYASVVMSSPCDFFTKASMIWFYLRLAPHPTFRIICYLSIAIMTICWGLIFLVNTFGCYPMAGGWNRLSPHFSSQCITTGWFFRLSVAYNLTTDLIVVLLPIPILMRMQLQIKAKIGLVFTFSMGFL